MNTETIMLSTVQHGVHLRHTEIEVRPITVLFGMRSTDVLMGYPDDFPPVHRFPEIMKHPTEQAELGSHFARLARGGTHQVIETTSVVLIMRILRLVKDGVLSTDEVIMYHVNQQEDQITTLFVTDRGKLDKPVPDSFFSQDVDELFGETLTDTQVFGGEA